MIDFLILFILAAAFVFVFLFFRSRNPDNKMYQIATGLALSGVLLLFWVNGAVGIIGKAGNGINLIYTGVVAVGFIFAIIGRFEPNRMSRALFAMAFGQIMVALISIITSAGSKGPIWPWDIVLFTGFFTALWVVSALLFRISARNESSAPGRPDCLSVSSD